MGLGGLPRRVEIAAAHRVDLAALGHDRAKVAAARARRSGFVVQLQPVRIVAIVVIPNAQLAQVVLCDETRPRTTSAPKVTACCVVVCCALMMWSSTLPKAMAAPSAVTDAELKLFAKAALAVDKVNKDAAVPAADKQKKMAEAVSGSGLPPARFNEIAQASQADPALQQKVQAAIVAEQQAGTTPTQ